MSEELESYILSHSDGEGELLGLLRRDAHVRLLRPRMIAGHLQGRLLKMICRMLNPRRVLEIGTYTGYATLCMAEGMEVGSLLHTVERNDELEPFVSRYISQSADREKIVLHWVDVVDVLPTLDEVFDLVYMDADKRDYCAHYDLVFPYVRIGGIILADNTLWSGKVTGGVEKLDSQTRGIMSFNDRISADTRIEKIIIPLRDGLTMIYKRSEC